MPALREVFGLSTKVPVYTYVDRARLDEKFEYLLSAEKHIVIYGASKQGKTVLRKKVLPDSQTILVQCRIHLTPQDIYTLILQQCSGTVLREEKSVYKVEGTATAELKGEVGLPKVTKIEGGGQIEVGGEFAKETVQATIGMDASNIQWLASQVQSSGKRIVIEDFHYLSQETQHALAFDLKAFYDLGVFVIIIGIWAENNMLLRFNGNLSGRIAEIELTWTNDELSQVLDKGENALNIAIPEEIRQHIVPDAQENIGLLQRLAEGFCFDSSILRSVNGDREILADEAKYTASRRSIAASERRRYEQFAVAFIRGFKGYETSQLRAYEMIARVCLNAEDHELIAGIDQDVLLQRVRVINNNIRQSDLTSALKNLDRLQVRRRIHPLVLSYNDTLRRILLVDRELLFFRRYGAPSWPWDLPAKEQLDFLTLIPDTWE